VKQLLRRVRRPAAEACGRIQEEDFTVSTPTLTDREVQTALQAWREYQSRHDLSGREGEAVGIDPHSSRIWFGESAVEVVDRMRADGIDVPLFFVRVGSDSYVRKGRR
jgi:hypothetical protein